MKLLNDVLTVDPGLMGTGWALWRNKKSPVGTGVLKTEHGKSAISWEERSHRISDGFSALLVTYTPKLVVIEFPGLFGADATSYAAASKGDLFKLTYLVGNLGVLVHRIGSKVETLPPSKWKGQMPKDVVDRRIMRAIGKKYPNHIGDAVGMGLYMMNEL